MPKLDMTPKGRRRSSQARALGRPLYRPRIVRPKRGKGSKLDRTPVIQLDRTPRG